MDRCSFLLTWLAGALVAPLVAKAQQAGKVYRVGCIFAVPVAGVLSDPTNADVLPRYGPRNDDFCRLMLHLLAAPNETAETPDASRRESLMGLCGARRPARAIAGGSDAQGWEPVGSARGPHLNQKE
jgi:hypothetical protein